MGKQRRITFNVKDIFLADQNSEEVRNIFLRSPLFGIVVAAYNRAKAQNLDALVGKISLRDSTSTIVQRVSIVTPKGVPVATVSNLDTTYTSINFSTHSNHLELPEHAMRQLSSSNPKYVQSKLSVKSEHDAALSFDSALKSGYNFFNEMMRHVVDELVDHVNGGRTRYRPTISPHSLTDEAVTFLVKVYAGELSMAQMRLDMRSHLDDTLKKYREQSAKFDGAIHKSTEFMDGEKWVLLENMNSGVVVGCVSPSGMVEGLNGYKNVGSLPYISDLNYAQETIPFKWYPSFSDIPDETRRAIEFSMMMLKTHRNSDDMLPKDCPGGRFWIDMGCFSQTSWNNGVHFHVLSR